ncbi:DUF1738 domain-containing protein [Acidithiobacillus sp. VAN18-1]|uniref:DUF1738 domain-containing protein n=1 Tax=Igneacidithiobacillus copahuensis TaxID=2724909 RepID=A0AAE3CJW1_9PROT|nr:zincin-like metallopeptidase domain-containing protein [Igneacidithiobacillus copahuensis]MBU2788227.1 DUF1738 domain-containing protein [Igneacidithiobacillus copahuensis]MBU2797103.1 DUF1738 domain-containing protein [Acidithiobacillus sp. VAN18-2]
MASRGKEEKRDFRLDVADRLIQQMEQGTARWQKPWKSGEVQVPVNAVTGKPYRGVNRETLMMFSPDASDPRWCTYKQAQEKGWQVRKGASGLPLEVWKEYEHKLTEEEIRRLEEQGATDIEPTEKRLGVRYYTVFHASQIDGIPPLERPDITHEVDGKPDERLPKLAEAMGVSLGYGGGAAFYHSSTDHVQMPPIETFEKAVGHDTTLLHELSHATGHEHRLSRKLGNPFGSPEYAVEELRAEMSAAMTAASLGLGFDPAAQDVEQDREAGNSAAYLAGWLKALPEKERKQTIMQVIKDAQSISDYLIERTPELEQAVEVGRDPGISVGEQEVATLSRGDYVRYNDELGREQEALIFDAEDGGQPNRYRIFPILRLYREDGSSLSIPGISDEPRIVSIPESVLKQHIPGVISPEAMDAIDPFTETYKRNMSDELQNPVEREVLLTVERALQEAQKEPEQPEKTPDAGLLESIPAIRTTLVLTPRTDIQPYVSDEVRYVPVSAVSGRVDEVEYKARELKMTMIDGSRVFVLMPDGLSFANFKDSGDYEKDLDKLFALKGMTVDIRAPNEKSVIIFDLDTGDDIYNGVSDRPRTPHYLLESAAVLPKSEGKLFYTLPHDGGREELESVTGKLNAVYDTNALEIQRKDGKPLLVFSPSSPMVPDGSNTDMNRYCGLIGKEITVKPQLRGLDVAEFYPDIATQAAREQLRQVTETMPDKMDALFDKTRETAAKLDPLDEQAQIKLRKDYQQGVDDVFGIIREGPDRGTDRHILELERAGVTEVYQTPEVQKYREISEKQRERASDFRRALDEQWKAQIRERGKEVLQGVDAGTTPVSKELEAAAVYWKQGIFVSEHSQPVRAILDDIEQKNLPRMLSLIGHNSQNPASQEVFTRMTGIALGKSQKERVAQLEAWAGPEKVAALQQAAAKKAEREREEAPRKALRVAFDALSSSQVRVSIDGGSRVVDGQEYIELKASRGYTQVGSHKNGAVVERFLRNPQTSATTRFNDRRFNEFCKAVQSLDPDGDLVKAMETAKIPLNLPEKPLEKAQEPQVSSAGLSDSVGAADRLAKSLEVLEQHSLTLPRPDGTHKTVNARRYLDEGIARGFTQADTTANPLAWINPETQKRLTVRDDALAATLRAAQAVDTHVGRAIQSVARQKTDLEWEM